MIADTLRRAAAAVRERGLAKGRYQDAENRVCTFGALALACFGDVRTFAAESGEVESIAAEVAREAGVPIYRLSEWNDAPERTADEVIAALEAAAARLEATT